jgi:hypothetical protein
MADEPLEHGVRFTVKEAFPPDDPVARWVVALIMTLHDLLLVNRRLEETVDGAPEYENVYNARLAASHLWEAATFLRDADRRFEEISPASPRRHASTTQPFSRPEIRRAPVFPLISSACEITSSTMRS